MHIKRCRKRKQRRTVEHIRLGAIANRHCSS